MEAQLARRLAALAFVAGTVVACGNNPGGTVLSQELTHSFAEGGRNVTTLEIKGNSDRAQSQLEVNGGVNVRIDDDLNGISSGTLVGKIPVGEVVDKAVVFDSGNQGQWAATQCLNPAIQLDQTFKSYIEETQDPNQAMCYIDSGDFAQQISTPQK